MTKWQEGIFGKPDASRSDALANYIEIAGVLPNLRNETDRLRYRFIVGRKGAGKTHYLHALMQSLASSDVYVLRHIEQLPTDAVLQFTKSAQRFHARLAQDSLIYVDPYFYVRDFWESAWERAILCSVASILWTGGETPTSHEKADFTRSIADRDWARIRKFLPEIEVLRSPPKCLSAFMHRFAGFNRAKRFIGDPEWDFVRTTLQEAVTHVKPIVIILDSHDEDFESAPEPWLFCQDGLFKAMVNQLYQPNNFGNRVHIIAAIRDVVYSSMLRSDHALRLVRNSHVLNLHWDYNAARNFLFRKIDSIDVIKRGTYSNPVASWLGHDVVQNDSRGIIEPITQYILRHTRLVPRDIIILGNALAEMQLSVFSNDKLIETVHEVARLFAGDTIRTAVQELLMSREHVGDLFRQINEAIIENIDTTNNATLLMKKMAVDIRSMVNSKVDNLFRSLESEVFSFSSLVSALQKSGLTNNADFVAGKESPYRFDHILWRHGLISYQDHYGGRGAWKFYSSSPFESFLLPEEQPAYGLHTILLDLYSLSTVNGGGPII